MSSTRRSSPDLDKKMTPDALAAALVQLLPLKRGMTVLEPHVGDGAFVRALRARGCNVAGMDIDPEVPGFKDCDEYQVGDFLQFVPGDPYAIIGNPPFSDAEAHLRTALQVTDLGSRAGFLGPRRFVAFLLRLNFLGSRERVQAGWSKKHETPFWNEHPPSRVIVIVPRPSFTGGGNDSCEYAFFVWNGEPMKGVEWVTWEPEKKRGK